MSKITIKNNRFVCTIYNANSFLEMPLKNIRKLWKLMFDEAWNNVEAIEIVKRWLADYNPEISKKGKLVTASNATARAAQAEYNAVILTHTGRNKPAVEARKEAREKLRQAKMQARYNEKECREAANHSERVRILRGIFKDMENKVGVD